MNLKLETFEGQVEMSASGYFPISLRYRVGIIPLPLGGVSIFSGWGCGRCKGVRSKSKKAYHEFFHKYISSMTFK